MVGTTRLQNVLSELPKLSLPAENGPEFRMFSKLPLELQRIVWTYAAEDPRPRHHFLQSIHYDNGHFDYESISGGLWSQYPVPPLLHACRESRRAAELTYTPCKEIFAYPQNPIIWNQFYGHLNRPQQLKTFKCHEIERTQLRYVHFASDVLVHFPLDRERNPRWGFLSFRDESYNFSLADIARFQNMEILDINDTKLVQIAGWNAKPFKLVKNVSITMIWDGLDGHGFNSDFSLLLLQATIPRNRCKAIVTANKFSGAEFSYRYKSTSDSSETVDLVPVAPGDFNYRGRLMV